jgi:hypothetical protein
MRRSAANNYRGMPGCNHFLSMYAPPMPGTVAEGCQQVNGIPCHSAFATLRSFCPTFFFVLNLLLLLLLLMLPSQLVVAVPVYTILLVGAAATAAAA